MCHWAYFKKKNKRKKSQPPSLELLYEEELPLVLNAEFGMQELGPKQVEGTLNSSHSSLENLSCVTRSPFPDCEIQTDSHLYQILSLSLIIFATLFRSSPIADILISFIMDEGVKLFSKFRMYTTHLFTRDILMFLLFHFIMLPNIFMSFSLTEVLYWIIAYFPI